MVGQGGVKTLINREETHGRKFPGHIEKSGLLISIALAIFIGQWMWVESDWSELILWPATACGLPLFTLLIGEMLARITQKSMFVTTIKDLNYPDLQEQIPAGLKFSAMVQ